MAHFDDYARQFPHARLNRSPSGILEVTLHSNGETLIFERGMHDEFDELFYSIGKDNENRAVVLTGAGNAFIDRVHPKDFNFTTPRDHQMIHRASRKALLNLLDIPAPVIAAVNGPATIHSEYILLADIAIATPDTFFQERSLFNFGIIDGEGVRTLWSEVIGSVRGYAFVLNHQSIDAQEAKSLGVVSEIVTRERLSTRAREIAGKLIRTSDGASGRSRRTVLHRMPH
jgi:enoyl-CoA hydratase/carnithine racemase